MRQESEEKLTVQVTLLMSYVVAQFNICAKLPISSDDIPLIGRPTCTCILNTALSHLGRNNTRIQE